MTAARTAGLHKIGEVADLVGTTPRTIRYYEELGLLGRHGERCKGAHRLYDDDDVGRLEELLRLRDLIGLSLDELVEVAEGAQTQDCLDSRWASTTDDRDRAEILAAAIPHVRRQLELVRARRRSLDELEGRLRGKLERIERRLAELGAGRAPA